MPHACTHVHESHRTLARCEQAIWSPMPTMAILPRPGWRMTDTGVRLLVRVARESLILTPFPAPPPLSPTKSSRAGWPATLAGTANGRARARLAPENFFFVLSGGWMHVASLSRGEAAYRRCFGYLGRGREGKRGEERGRGEKGEGGQRRSERAEEGRGGGKGNSEGGEDAGRRGEGESVTRAHAGV